MQIAIFGAEGRVGRRVCALAEARGHAVIAIERGTDIAAYDPTPIDAVIDFSVAEATAEVCDFCRRHRCPLVSGVTGRSAEQQSMLDALSREVTVCALPNFARGMDILFKILGEFAPLLAEWDCEIVELHRRDKRDSPGGTAKKLAALVAGAKNFKKVTIHSLRSGDNFGTHTVLFANDFESITLTHSVHSRDAFAKGALLEAESIVALAQNVPDA